MRSLHLTGCAASFRTGALVTLMVLLPVHEVSAYLGPFVLR